MIRIRRSFALSVLFCASSALAQGRSVTSEVDPGGGLPQFDGRVPIHTQAADPEFGAYGIWAAGLGFKASFHDGFAFWPALGPRAPRALPLRWRTESVRLGDAELLGETVDTSSTPWRYEYRHGRGVVERYDVRTDGVEQSFVVERPRVLAAGGALTVCGRIASEEWTARLQAVDDDGVRSAIVFEDRAGSEVLRYGGAIAIDARGERVDVRTELAGDEVRLVVPAEWVRGAAWPITIDPLLTPTVLQTFGLASGVIESSDVVLAGPQSGLRVLTTMAFPFAGNDVDLYAVLTDEDLQTPTLVYADLASTYDSVDPRAAFVDEAGPNGRWVVGFARRTSATSRIRVLLHDADDTTLQSGSILFLPATTAQSDDRRPDVGGARSGDHALLVFENDFSDGIRETLDPSDVRFTRVDAENGTFGPVQHLDSGGGALLDYERPSVSQVADGAPLYWMTCWQQRAAAGDWQLAARRIEVGGASSASHTIVTSLPGEPLHTLQPSVDGNNTRFGVSYVLAESVGDAFGSRVAVTRFFWSGTAAVPSVDWSQVVDVTDLALGGRFDAPRTTVDVHAGNFAIAYRERRLLLGIDWILAARIGFDGDVVETALVQTSGSAHGGGPAIAYDFPNLRFVVTYGVEGSSLVYGRLWTYPTDATKLPYGNGCATGTFGPISTPLVGTEFFRVRLAGARPDTPAVLWIGFQPTVAALDFLGMPGCDLLVDPSVLVSLPATTDSMGDAVATIVGLLSPFDLYLQWAYIDVGATPLGVVTTGAVRSRVR